MAKSRLSYVFLCLLALATFFGSAQAQVAKQGHDTLTSLAFTHERLVYSQPVEPIEDSGSAVDQATQSAWQSFRLNAPVEWRAAVDRRHGNVALAEGGNIAWIPGR